MSAFSFGSFARACVCRVVAAVQAWRWRKVRVFVNYASTGTEIAVVAPKCGLRARALNSQQRRKRDRYKGTGRESSSAARDSAPFDSTRLAADVGSAKDRKSRSEKAVGETRERRMFSSAVAAVPDLRRIARLAKATRGKTGARLSIYRRR